MQHSGLQGSDVVLTKPDSLFLISFLHNRNRCTCFQNYGSLWFTQSPLNNKVRYFVVQITIFVTSFTFYFAVEETTSKNMIFPCSHAFCPLYFTNFQETTGRRKSMYTVLSFSGKIKKKKKMCSDIHKIYTVNRIQFSLLQSCWKCEQRQFAFENDKELCSTLIYQRSLQICSLRMIFFSCFMPQRHPWPITIVYLRPSVPESLM